MQGKIIKGIGGFYYVKTEESLLYACRAKGIFRKDKMKPLVGDNVEFQITHQQDMEGSVEVILPRNNQLIRPAVANVDQAIVIFALDHPKPNHMLLDRFLVNMEVQNIPTVICFNKKDLGTELELRMLYDTYCNCGYRVLLTSAAQEEGIQELKEILAHKTSVVAGPSGVGKSSLTNLVQDSVSMETGEISRKLGRGKHTTRHSELIPVGEDTYIVDTPGFSSLYVQNMEKEELRDYFIEFHAYEGKCRFHGCTHIHEPDCAVMEAVKLGKISTIRYEDYRELYHELEQQRRY